jgi:hypothetical protein
MPVVTPMPMPWLTALDATGTPLQSGYARFFAAGTSTLQVVYQDASGLVPHPDPMPFDSAGRAVVFFQANRSYKVQLFNSAMVLQEEVDFLSAVPTLSADLDYNALAGEAIPALSPMYFENGSGGGTIGKWYRTDSGTVAKSSGAAVVAIAPAAIALNEVGKARTIGLVSGFLGLTPGSPYYIGPAGTIVLAPPANVRLIGIASSATELLLPPPQQGLLVSGQSALDFLYAAGPASIGRVAAVAGMSPQVNEAGTAWVMGEPGLPEFADPITVGGSRFGGFSAW